VTTLDSLDDFASAVQAYFTPDELDNAVAYAAVTEIPFAAGTQLQFPGTMVEVHAESWLAFIDRVPMANWGHPARYLLVERESRKSFSFETRFPPFQPHGEFRWRVIYKAPSVPDAAVAIPQ
jgi:hypothetical protein